MTYKVVFAKAARNDLDDLFEWIADRAGIDTALKYAARIHTYCLALEQFPARGTSWDDLRPGLRIVGFERRVTIAFAIRGRTVTILRIFGASRDIDAALSGL